MSNEIYIFNKIIFCFILQTPVVVDPKSLTEGIDLLSVNDHLTNSEVIGKLLWKSFRLMIDLVL